MAKRQKHHLLLGAIGLLLAAGACSDVTEPAGVQPAGRSATIIEEPVPTGARIQVSKTAVAEWTTGTRYEWSLKKTGPLDLEVPTGQSAAYNYVVTATRTLAGTSEFFGVTGQLCVTNNGPDATQNLSIADQLQYWDDAVGDWQNFGAPVAVDVSAKPVLEAFTTYCYPYKVSIDPATVPFSKLGYRNTAKISISNFMAGYEDYAHVQTAPFVFPTSPTGGTTGATATVVDALTCPAGFTCSFSGATWTFTDSGSQTVPVTITNVSVPCFKTRDVVNTAKLTAGVLERTATVETSVWTGDLCGPQPPSVGCTPGFWKQSKHAQYWINHTTTDLIGTVFNQSARYTYEGTRLSNWTLLQGLQGGGGPGQVGAAKILLRAAIANLLNTEASGISPDALINSVNAALASEDRATMIALAEKLDALNNGTCTVKK
jgi:hypothetical protein